MDLCLTRGMLDEHHQPLQQDPGDGNNYTLGRMGVHNVVLACLPYGVSGLTSAAAVALQMRSSFKYLRFGLMVGIGGGVPSRENDIRLGDVVVSKPTEQSGGVIQYDFWKTVQEGRFKLTGSLNRPPDVLLWVPNYSTNRWISTLRTNSSTAVTGHTILCQGVSCQSSCMSARVRQQTARASSTVPGTKIHGAWRRRQGTLSTSNIWTNRNHLKSVCERKRRDCRCRKA
jgi:hypothetical protein